MYLLCAALCESFTPAPELRRWGWTDVTFLHEFTATPALLVDIQILGAKTWLAWNILWKRWGGYHGLLNDFWWAFDIILPLQMEQVVWCFLGMFRSNPATWLSRTIFQWSHSGRTSNNEERVLPSQAVSVPWMTASAKSLTTTGVKLTLDSNTAAGTGQGWEDGWIQIKNDKN